MLQTVNVQPLLYSGTHIILLLLILLYISYRRGDQATGVHTGGETRLQGFIQGFMSVLNMYMHCATIAYIYIQVPSIFGVFYYMTWMGIPFDYDTIPRW